MKNKVTFFVVAFVMLSFIFNFQAKAQFNLNKLKKTVENEIKKTDEKKDDVKNKSNDTPIKDEEKEKAKNFIYSTWYKFDQPVNDIDGGYVGMYASNPEKGKALYNALKATDYQATKAKMDEYMKKYPDFNREGYEPYGEYMNYTQKWPKKLENKIDEYFISEINNCIDKAYADKENNKKRAYEIAESGVYLCKAILLILPKHEKINSLLKDAESVFKKIESEYSSAVFTSDFHKENAGKIVFAKKPIEINQEGSCEVTSQFTGKDFIYGMVYFKSSMRELDYGSLKFTVRIYADNNEIKSRDFEVAQAKKENTYLDFEFVPDPETHKTMGCIEYSTALAKLSPRRHDIKVVLTITGSGTEVASGEFELDGSGGMEGIESVAKTLTNAEFSSRKMPEPAMKNAKLEKEMLEAMSSWTEKPLKAVIVDSDWSIHRNQYTGIIEYRSILAAIGMKKPDGNCRVFWLSFKQDYNGKSYGKTQHLGVGDSMDLPCENVK